MDAKDLKIGMLVKVVPHTIYSDLVVNTTVTPMREHLHTRYHQAVITGLDSDGMGGTIVEVKIGHSVDYVRPEAVEAIPPRRTSARFYVRVMAGRKNIAFYGPFASKSEAKQRAEAENAAAERRERESKSSAAEYTPGDDPRVQNAPRAYARVMTHTEMVKEFGREFEDHPEYFLA